MSSPNSGKTNLEHRLPVVEDDVSNFDAAHEFDVTEDDPPANMYASQILDRIHPASAVNEARSIIPPRPDFDDYDFASATNMTEVDFYDFDPDLIDEANSPPETLDPYGLGPLFRHPNSSETTLADHSSICFLLEGEVQEMLSELDDDDDLDRVAVERALRFESGNLLFYPCQSDEFWDSDGSYDPFDYIEWPEDSNDNRSAPSS